MLQLHYGRVNKKILIISLLLAVLAIVYGMLFISFKNITETNAKNAVGNEISELFDNQVKLSSAQGNFCQTTRNTLNWIGWTTCRYTTTVYYVWDGDNKTVQSTIYQLLNRNGWWVMDNGMLNDNGFDSLGYLDSVTNKDTGYDNINEFNLVVKIVDKHDINIETSLSSETKEELTSYLSADKQQVIRVGLSVVYRR
jgi:hypothetical protein